MQPTISRETVLIDRRQPTLRWSAVIAGTVCSVGFWMLLQLFGLGIDLAAVDVDNARSLRGAGLGTTVWSLVSPVVAMFFGGLVTGKLAQTPDRKLAGAHGLVMWAITSVLGLCATLGIVAMIAAGAARGSAAASDPTGNPGATAADRELATPSALGIDTDELLATINQRFAAQGKPAITAAQLEAAMRGVVRTGIARGDFDQELLVDQLVATARMSRGDAAEVERQIEARLDAHYARPHHLERRLERSALWAADATGKALVTIGFSLLLSLVTSVLGAMVALRRSRRAGGKSPRRSVHDTAPGYSPPIEPAPTTPPYPSPASGLATPVVPPNDVTAP